MLRKITINVLTILLLTLGSQPLFAQPGYNGMLPHTESQTADRHYHTPVSTLQRIITESRLYDYLLNHPKFIKIQEIACRVWEKQTGSKRRVSYSRRQIFSRRID
ncbi:MAG: hypothetical protein ACPGSM_02625 [Thiolinea sp.]